LVLRCGDIDNRFSDSSAMYEGAAAHRKIQREAGENYKKEVPLKLETQIDGIPVIFNGRADGIITEPGGGIIIDEIKTTTLPLEYIYAQYEQHLGQGKCYAHMYLQTLENRPESITVQITYYQLESREIKKYRQSFTGSELNEFFTCLIQKYGLWLKFERDWKITRDESITKTGFPFETYRKGQRELAVAAYRVISTRKKLYASAPTGIGKTLSALFPSIKALGAGKAEKLFYLTAKTITRTVAEDAVRLMAGKGLRFKSITLRAKEKICLNEIFICNPDNCEYAKGHYNRVNNALFDLLQNNDLITPEETGQYAEKHRVCPHEFALDAALWCDLVIGDYNHVFDPVVYLRRFFNDDDRDYVFLIDEAHNLVDRVRDMYTAALRKNAFSRIRNQLKDKDKVSTELRKTLRKVNTYLADIRKELVHQKNRVEEKQDTQFKELVTAVFLAAGEWLAAKKNMRHELNDAALELFFETRMFLMISDFYDEHYTSIIETGGNDVSITLFCIDPSEFITSGLARGKSSVLFSATLIPLPYYREILGGKADDVMLSLPSPFDPARLLTVAHCGISTKYKDREKSYTPIAQTIRAAVSQKKGNYLIFFPSYEYMHKVYDLFCENYPDIKTLLQKNDMTEAGRLEFLARFDGDNPETLAGFAVLGGVFSEGIDLKGDRLTGSVIIGVGIPKITLRHDLIRGYFDCKNGQGYDYAYVYPGMNKILQAAGRVIRTETDSGTVLLIDSRYSTAKYRGLFPEHWTNMKLIRNTGEFEQITKNSEQ